MNGSTLARRALAAACSSAIALACAWPALAAAYPDKPVRLIVPFATGGGSDTVARVIGEKLAARWKQPVIVENRPGAGGALGANLVAKAEPDGYTLLLSDASAITINPTLYPNLPYAGKDLVPVSNVATFALVLVVPANSGLASVADVIARERKQPGSLNGASAGTGSSPHLVQELFNTRTGVAITHVPYKGGGPAMVDVISGQVDLMFNGLSANTTPLITTGKVKALAVTTPERVPTLPDVPTVAEAGVAGFDVVSAQTVFVPAGTPAAIVAQLNADLAAVLALPDIKERWDRSSYLPYAGESPGQLSAWFAAETIRWTRLIRERNITVD